MPKKYVQGPSAHYIEQFSLNFYLSKFHLNMNGAKLEA